MPEVLDRPRTTAFVEADEEFPIQSTGASAFGEGFSHSRRWIVSDDVGWARWFIAILSLDVARLKKDVQQLNRELPRFQQFRKDFEQFLCSSYRQRAEKRNAIVNSMRLSAVPSIYIHDVLRQCATGGGPDGLDIGIDLLAGFGDTLLGVFDSFLQKDRSRWPGASSAKHVNDDVCYVLLRALARSNAVNEKKMALIAQCLASGTNSIREAATHALGDMGGETAKKLLKHTVDHDPDNLVRESAQEALADLDA
jgi:hypothetical protein